MRKSSTWNNPDSVLAHALLVSQGLIRFSSPRCSTWNSKRSAPSRLRNIPHRAHLRTRTHRGPSGSSAGHSSFVFHVELTPGLLPGARTNGQLCARCILQAMQRADSTCGPLRPKKLLKTSTRRQCSTWNTGVLGDVESECTDAPAGAATTCSTWNTRTKSARAERTDNPVCRAAGPWDGRRAKRPPGMHARAAATQETPGRVPHGTSPGRT